MILDVLTDWLAGGVPGVLWGETQRLLGFWGPVASLPGLAFPVGLLGSALAVVILTGVALASLGTFLVAALVLYLLLTEVFGLSIEVSLP